MSEKKIVDIPGLSAGMAAAGIPISPLVQANGMLYLSGMPPLDVNTGSIIKNLDIAAQTRHCLDGIRNVLESAGSSMDKIISMRVYCSEPGQFAAVNDAYRSYFPQEPPARTFVPVTSWQMGFDVELECIALS